MHETFEFYEETFSNCYSYFCYKQVFVDEVACDFKSYAAISCNRLSLWDEKNHDASNYQTVFRLFHLHAKLIGYVTSERNKSVLGRTLSKKVIWEFIQSTLNDVKYEEQYGGIILDPSKTSAHLPVGAKTKANFYFSNKNLHTRGSLTCLYTWKRFSKRPYWIRQELLCQVFGC